MYAMAGIELVPVPASVPAPVPASVPAPVPSVQGRIESTIRQAMAPAPTVNGTTVKFKIVVVNDLNNCGPNYILIIYIYCSVIRFSCLNIRFSCLNIRFSCLNIRFSCLDIRFSCLNMLGWVGLVWKSSPTI
jgi:hypothetical protein